ncbi:MAG: hypothetical protein AMJ54_09580 [Deltaproteobacteria bacterium SG8_13]|nr:MAG: hypothetical protein AMJ54_09580 [Deltaproteobacteria bacterium SG8_13]
MRQAADRFAPYVPRLQAVFSAMDLAYVEVAGTYRFRCSGCEDNCCRTRFHHHTYLEFFYLHHGWEKLEKQRREILMSRADDVCRAMDALAPGRDTHRRMCPLNVDGLCELYEHRPMICRLHGIPHVLQRPDGRKTTGSGCDAFHRHYGDRSDAVLERTPHYGALAALEQEFRRTVGLADKLKMTVAEMIVRFTFLCITH